MKLMNLIKESFNSNSRIKDKNIMIKYNIINMII